MVFSTESSWVAEEGENFQLVLPYSLKRCVLQGFHDEVGHLGRDKTLDLTVSATFLLAWHGERCG